MNLEGASTVVINIRNSQYYYYYLLFISLFRPFRMVRKCVHEENITTLTFIDFKVSLVANDSNNSSKDSVNPTLIPINIYCYLTVAITMRVGLFSVFIFPVFFSSCVVDTFVPLKWFIVFGQQIANNKRWWVTVDCQNLYHVSMLKSSQLSSWFEFNFKH